MCYSSACTFLTLILYLEIYQYLILRGNLTQYGGDWSFRFLIKDNYNKAVRLVNLLGKRTLKKTTASTCVLILRKSLVQNQ